VFVLPADYIIFVMVVMLLTLILAAFKTAFYGQYL